jgi:O-antigen/teichoic acid export membrane protein
MTITSFDEPTSALRALWKSVVSVSAARVYSLAISAAMVMIVARWLGPGGQGIVAASAAWATLFATLGSLSLGQVAIHRATIKRGQAWIGQTMGTLLVLAGAITLLCWAVAAIIYAASSGRMFGAIPPLALVVGFLIVPFNVWELYGSNLLTAADRIDTYNRAQIIGRSVGIVLMLVCWLWHLGVVAAIAVGVVSQMIVSSIGIRALWQSAGGQVRATLAEARALLGGAVQLHVNAISGYIYTSLGVLIVNRYCSAAETGWYQFSASLVNVIGVIPMAASLVFSSRVAQLGPEEAWASQRKVLLYLPALMIVIAVIAAIAAPTAIPLVVGEKYMPAVPLFQLSLLGVVGLTASSVMASQWIGRGYFWQMSASSVVVAAIHLTATLMLVRRHGMYGAVYANLITSGVAIVGNGIFALFCEMKFRNRAARARADV